MKQIIKNNSFSLLITILGIGIVVAGILLMALNHDMSWQSYVIIGVIMFVSLWTIFNNRHALKVADKKIRIQDEQEFYQGED